ncbi:MAG TPA: hypothetical protein EYP21_00735 [Syntrophaceae bacterium]|nr:hypothetical protein [Syntrophaceae bacterium]
MFNSIDIVSWGTTLGGGSLIYVIFKDSKKRLGKYHWKWAIGMGLLLMSAIGQEYRYILSRLEKWVELGSFLGSLFGLWIGCFLLYRLSTRKAAKNKNTP